MNIFQKVTVKTLRENKTRTIVTIVGILLSLSMFTAVTTSIASFYSFLWESTLVREGNWHGAVYGLPETDAAKINSEDKLAAFTLLEDVGYASLEDSANPDKPYLYVGGMDENAKDLLPIRITDGRMPEHANELLLPKHLAVNGNVHYKIGDTLTLNLGRRIQNDPELSKMELYQNYSFVQPSDRGENDSGQEESSLDESDESNGSSLMEILETDFSRTYTVTGFYERPATEPYSAPGYTALTLGDGTSGHTYTAFLRFTDPKTAIPWLEENYPDSFLVNYELLRLSTATYESGYNQVIYSLGMILIIIIVFGSIALIYNAFSISVSERTRQFGLLASLGATKKQLIHSVLFEAFALCIIGIPLGVLAGLTGIGITFHFVGDMVSTVLFGASEAYVPLKLIISAPAILVAILLGLATILLSAWLPAQRAMRIPPIDAIRQVRDISIRPGRVRTWGLTLKLFGLPGMLAAKNFKRNRKKYRATVLSLFVSVVLFISASSYCSYLTKSAESVLSDAGYDLVFRNSSLMETDDLTEDELLEMLSSVKGVTKGTWTHQFYTDVKLNTEDLSSDFRDYMNRDSSPLYPSDEEGRIKYNAILYFVDDTEYASYLKECDLSVSEYMGSSSPKGIALNRLRIYDGKKYLDFPLLNDNAKDVTLTQIQSPEGYYLYDVEYDENGMETHCIFADNDTDETMRLPVTECTATLPLSIGSFQEKAPYFLGDGYMYTLCLLYPASSMEQVLNGYSLGTNSGYTYYYFTSSDHKTSYQKMTEVLTSLGTDLGFSDNSLLDYAASVESDRMMITILNVFAFGFITLISLISAANVFNTISTNFSLRRREFAMLKSIGLTPGGFRTMMRYECLLYGCKGLLYGLPVSLLMTYFIYRGISNGLELHFYVPWHSIVIAVGSVFAVVFATMIYSMHKMKKDNPIDALKDENI